MLRRLTNRLNYANVVATLALFIVLGGTSYAKIELSKNSVGSTQISPSAVTTSKIRNRTIKLEDMSLSARSSLRGKSGPQGPPGAPGANAVSFHTAVSSAGGVSNASAHGGRTGIGTYTIGFTANVAACDAVATIGTTDGTVAPVGTVQVNHIGDSIGIQTYDASNTPADLPTEVAIFC